MRQDFPLSLFLARIPVLVVTVFFGLLALYSVGLIGRGYQLIGVPGLWLGTACVVLGVIRLLDKSPVLRMDDEGIHLAGQPAMAWDDLDEAYASTRNIFGRLVLCARDPQDYLDRLSPFRRAWAQINMPLTEGQAHLPLYLLPARGDDIAARIMWIKENGFEAAYTRKSNAAAAKQATLVEDIEQLA